MPPPRWRPDFPRANHNKAMARHLSNTRPPPSMPHRDRFATDTNEPRTASLQSPTEWPLLQTVCVEPKRTKRIGTTPRQQSCNNAFVHIAMNCVCTVSHPMPDVPFPPTTGPPTRITDRFPHMARLKRQKHNIYELSLCTIKESNLILYSCFYFHRYSFESLFNSSLYLCLSTSAISTYFFFTLSSVALQATATSVINSLGDFSGYFSATDCRTSLIKNA